MAITKATSVFAALFFFFVVGVKSSQSEVGAGFIFQKFQLEVHKGGKWAAQGIDCGSKCAYRCSKASRHEMCARACNTCCQRCQCVPPGTSGNYDTCPCYANMTTHGGRHKCP